MKLKEVLHGINYEIIQGSLDININGICYDSRKVNDGDIFVCLTGALSDGHDYIDMAVNKGASVIIVQKDVVVSENITVIKLSDTRKYLSK